MDLLGAAYGSEDESASSDSREGECPSPSKRRRLEGGPPSAPTGKPAPEERGCGEESSGRASPDAAVRTASTASRHQQSGPAAATETFKPLHLDAAPLVQTHAADIYRVVDGVLPHHHSGGPASAKRGGHSASKRGGTGPPAGVSLVEVHQSGLLGSGARSEEGMEAWNAAQASSGPAPSWKASRKHQLSSLVHASRSVAKQGPTKSKAEVGRKYGW